MIRSWKIRQLGWCVVFAVFLCGCGKPPPPPATTSQLTGKVTLDGKPLANASIIFTTTDEAQSDHNGGATTMQDGMYETELTWVGQYKVTFEPGPDPMADGGDAAAGDDPTAGADPTASAPESSFPAQYRGVDTTPLTADVTAGPGTYDFELTSGG